MTAITCVKIRIDMPLPTPRSVISSPIHMMTAVPDTMVITMVAIVKTDEFGMSGLAAVRVQRGRTGPAPRTRWTAARQPDGQVPGVLGDLGRARLALVLQRSSRGMTTVSSCRMMLAVMYGMMPSANTDIRSSALPLSRLISW